MSSYPIDPTYGAGPNPLHPAAGQPPIVMPPPQPAAQYFPPAQYDGAGQYQQNTNFNQPFPQYGLPMGQPQPNQPVYYTQQQQQPLQQQQQQSRGQGCCDTLTTMMAGACAGMMCYMCLCEDGGCCQDGGLMDGEGNPGQSLMGFDD